MFAEQDLAAWDPEPLGRALTAAGYTAGAFRAADSDERMLVATSESPLFGAAHRLFAAGRPVPRADAEMLLGEALAPLAGLGLLRMEADQVSSLARLEPDGSSWFASDHPARLADEHVMGIGHSTRILAALAPARKGLRALDLCTGAGWIALQLAKAGCQVTATDVSKRALGFALFNSRLRDQPSIEFLRGDRLDPVAGRRFDLITANPPFVISPESNFTFRDSGQRGTAFCEDLARSLPAHLAPDGIAILLLSWFDDGDEENAHGPLEWAACGDCSAWLFRTLTQAPAEYARQWLQDSSAGRPPAAADLGRWMDHFADLGARRLHTGFLILHRGGEPCWQRSDARRIEQLRVDVGRDILAVIRGESWLAREEPDAERLLGTRFEVPAGLRLESVAELKESWTTIGLRLLSPGRLAYDGPVDGALPRLLSHCRGGRAPAELIPDLAGHEEPAPELSGRLAVIVREMVRHGLLAPPGPSDDPSSLQSATPPDKGVSAP